MQAGHVEAMRQYLLGTLGEDERQRLEREFLRDDEAFEELRALENELLYDYAQGGLSPDDRRHFEERYLGLPEGRQKLAQARALLAKIAPAAKPARPVFPFLAAAAALAVGLAVGWLALKGSPPDDTARRSIPAPSRLPPTSASLSRPAASPPSSTRPPTAGSSAAVFALALAPGLTRGADQPRRIALPPEATVVRLQLDVPKASRSPHYRAALRTAEGESIWTGSGPWPGASGRVLVLEIPARALKEADYELTLAAEGTRGVEEIAEYYFGILRP